jgi:hypothetical protein
VPLIYHPEYLMNYIKTGKFFELFTGLLTGAIPLPVEKITGGNISIYGISKGYQGPGVLGADGNKLVVKSSTFVWGYKKPYTLAVKTKDGFEITQNNTVLKTVSKNDFSNDTIPHEYVSLEDFKTWYNSASTGDTVTLDYALANFNDGRNAVQPDKIKTYFGEDVVKYMETHTGNAVVMAYNGTVHEKVIGSTSTIMNYYSYLDNNKRVYNAASFIKAWNNTIIPPHTTATGRNNVSYVSVYDPTTNSTATKYASHGVCPPGRALRDACLDAGLPLPNGMTTEYKDVVASWADLTTDIKVQNTGDYPIKIVIWSNGGSNGSGMTNIYAEVIQLTP